LSGSSECHTSLGKAPQNREEEVTGQGKWLAAACSNCLILLTVARVSFDLRCWLFRSLPPTLVATFIDYDGSDYFDRGS